MQTQDLFVIALKYGRIMEASHRNLTHQLVHELGTAILRAEYAQGANLPSEASLCEQYTMSRTVTREAVKMLTAKGLISSRPRQGIKVQPVENWNLFDTDVLNWILLGKPDLKMLQQFLQMRLAIESQAAYLAAQQATNDDLLLIEQALTAMKQSESGFNDSHEADVLFHQQILLASHNPFFMQLKHFIATALKVNIRFTNRFKAVTTNEYQAHVDIYDHIKNRRPTEARQSAMVTLQTTLDLVSEQLST